MNSNLEWKMAYDTSEDAVQKQSIVLLSFYALIMIFIDSFTIKFYGFLFSFSNVENCICFYGIFVSFRLYV